MKGMTMFQFNEVVFKKLHLHILETVLLFLIVIPIHYHYEVPLVVYFFVAGLAMILFQGLLRLSETQLLSIMSIPLVAVFAIQSGYPLFIGILLSLVFYWRNTILYEKELFEEDKILLMTILVGIPYYFAFGDIPIFWIVIGQLILIVTMKVLTISFFSDQKKGQSWKYIGTYSLILFGCFATSMVAVFVYPYLLRMLFSLYMLIISVVAWLGQPLYYLAQLIEINLEHNPQDQADTNSEGLYSLNLDTPFENVDGGGNEYYTFIPWMIGVFALVLLSIFIYKNIHKKTVEGFNRNAAHTKIFEEKKPRKKVKPTFKSKDKLLNEVRRSFHSLEKSLAKIGYVRGRSETVEDWFSNLPVTTVDKQEIKTLYEAVRYGNQRPEKEKIKQYNSAIKEIKKEMKEIYKETGKVSV